MNQGTKYRFVSDKIKQFTWRQRILLFTVQRDLARRRDGDVSGWYGDLKESIYMFSSGYVHLSDEIFINTVYWGELEEYGKPDQYGEGGIDLPPGHTGLAYPASGKRRSFNLAARKLIREEILWGFTNSFRSIQGLGGKSTPHYYKCGAKRIEISLKIFLLYRLRKTASITPKRYYTKTHK